MIVEAALIAGLNLFGSRAGITARQAPGAAAAPVEIVVTGCVQNAPATAGTVGSTDTTDDSAGARFLLTTVRAAAGADGAPVTRTRLAETYRLIAKTDMTGQVGKTVKISGSVVPSEAASEQSSTRSAARVPLLRVGSVTPTGQTCVPGSTQPGPSAR